MMFGENKGSAAVAERIPAGSVGIEIGVWRGDSAARFLATGRVRTLHLVDPWSVRAYEGVPGFAERYAPLVGSTDPDAIQAYYDRVYEDVSTKFAVDGRVKLWRMTSGEFFVADAAPSWADWIYIDGSHEYEGVLADLFRAEATCVRIFGDDYGNKLGVKRAVDDFARETGLRLEVFAGNQYEIHRASE